MIAVIRRQNFQYTIWLMNTKTETVDLHWIKPTCVVPRTHGHPDSIMTEAHKQKRISKNLEGFRGLNYYNFQRKYGPLHSFVKHKRFKKKPDTWSVPGSSFALDSPSDHQYSLERNNHSTMVSRYLNEDKWFVVWHPNFKFGRHSIFSNVALELKMRRKGPFCIPIHSIKQYNEKIVKLPSQAPSHYQLANCTTSRDPPPEFYYLSPRKISWTCCISTNSNNPTVPTIVITYGAKNGNKMRPWRFHKVGDLRSKLQCVLPYLFIGPRRWLDIQEWVSGAPWAVIRNAKEFPSSGFLISKRGRKIQGDSKSENLCRDSEYGEAIWLVDSCCNIMR